MINHTIIFDNIPVYIPFTSTIAGPKESEGPLREYYHNTLKDDLLGEKSHEKAEIKMHVGAINYLMNSARMTEKDIDCAISGDLLDEIIGCNFTMREFDFPFLGVYNACASFGEALILGANFINSGKMDRVICSTTSHFSTAERQYRYPLELGSQRTPLTQWTVTGAGCSLLSSKEPSKIRITSGTIGKVVDYGISDANNMGAAMAPAAMNTIITHLTDMKRSVDYYDLIVTGDLGHAGSRLLQKMMLDKGYDLSKNYSDCGVLIFNREGQNVNQGGSGACCSNLVFNSYIYKQMLNGKYRRVLLVPTGALVSKISSLQGETVPAIAHAVAIEVI